MKKIFLFFCTFIIVLGFQNCTKEVNFKADDIASMMGVQLQIIPDPSNIYEYQENLKFDLKVTLPEEGQIKGYRIKVNNDVITYDKDAAGNIKFSFIATLLTTYKVEAEVWTPNGTNFKTSHTLTIIDEKPPIISITPSSQNVYSLGYPLTFDFEVLDAGGGQIDKVNCFSDNMAKACQYDHQSSRGTITLTNLSSGAHNFKIIAADNSQNESTKDLNFSVEVDKIPPRITITPDRNNRYFTIDQQIFNLNVEEFGSGLQSVNCFINNEALPCDARVGDNPLNINLNAVGLYTLRVQATDNDQNTGTNTYSFTMKDDSIAPAIIINAASTNNYLVPLAQAFSVEIVENDSGLGNYSCFLNNIPFNCSLSTGMNSVQVSPTIAGSQTLRIDVFDRYNNKGTKSFVFDMIADTSAPVIQLMADLTNSYLINQPTKFNFTVSDAGGSGIKYVTCYDDTSITPCSFDSGTGIGMLSITYATTGAKIIKIVASDIAGNSATKSHSFSIKELEEVIQTLNIGIIKKVDVLIVIDNSSSMRQEQANMAARIDSFVSKIQNMDWRAAVTTTDIPLNDGSLLPIKNTSPAEYFISSAMDTFTAQKNLGDTVQGVGTNGYVFEQGIRATYRAIEKRDQQPNASFFRSDAALAVILISDEDEYNGGPTNKPENLLSYFKETWPEKSFSFSSIVKTDETCEGLILGTAYLKMSELTGQGLKGGAVTGCIGDTDYSTVLGKIGSSIQKINNTISLQCTPYPGTAITIKKDGLTYSGAFTLSNNVLSFNEDLPYGNYNITFQCEKTK